MNSTSGHPLGAILAGGRSRRMGADKALLDVAGTSMIVRVAAALREAGCEPLVVGHSSSFSGLIAIPDDLPGQAGPAAGLATALRVAAGRPVVLVAADQPFLRPQTIRALLALEGDAIVPIDGGANQATCAVYRAECLVPLRKLMAERPSPPLQALLDRVSTRRVLPAEWSRWGEEGHSWWSLDTPEDVLAAEAWLEENPESRIQHRDTDPREATTARSGPDRKPETNRPDRGNGPRASCCM